MQSYIFSFSSSSYLLPARQSLLRRYGSSPIGQASTHLAHLIQLLSCFLFVSSSVIRRKADVPFRVEASMFATALPIIGPPLINLAASLGNPPTASSILENGVPTLSKKFLCSVTQLPVTVTALSISG